MAEIAKEDVAGLLAKAEALTPQEGSNLPVGHSKNISPEDAIALADKHDNKEVLSNGQEVFKEEEIKPAGEEEDGYKPSDDAPDLTGMSLDEQITALNEYKLKKEQAENPLASVEKKVEEAGLDLEALGKEYADNGTLTEESFKALADAGFDKVAINAYIEAKDALVEKKVTQVINETCGSRENFDAMAEWMKESLSQPELDRYNAGIGTPQAQLYLENMYLKYQGAKPETKRVIRGNGEQLRNTNDKAGFKSQGEMILAMQDPRYKSDPSYRQSVQKRVSLM